MWWTSRRTRVQEQGRRQQGCSSSVSTCAAPRLQVPPYATLTKVQTPTTVTSTLQTTNLQDEAVTPLSGVATSLLVMGVVYTVTKQAVSLKEAFIAGFVSSTLSTSEHGNIRSVISRPTYAVAVVPAQPPNTTLPRTRRTGTMWALTWTSIYEVHTSARQFDRSANRPLANYLERPLVRCIGTPTTRSESIGQSPLVPVYLSLSYLLLTLAAVLSS